MKITHKLNSFLGSLVIAFAIALFLPSAANATYGSYNNNTYSSYGNNQSAQYTQYKAQAIRYLKAYYRCYNEQYYRYYVYYIKKARACQTKATTNNCSKYKTLSDKYRNAYYRCGNYCYYRYYVYYKNKYAKCQASTNPTGKLYGQVFEDSDYNNAYSASDRPLVNVSVKVTDSKGKSQIVKTGAKGYYVAKNLATGTATVVIVESTLPDNATQVVGTHTTTVNVKANKLTWEERNGYSFPEPTGKVCGSVFEDTNGNTVQDSGEPFYAGARVTITDANGKSVTAITNAQGKYCKDGIEAGDATIKVDLNSLPSGATITTENPTTIDVEAGKTNQAGKDGFEPAATVGKVCGSVFEDTNGNTVQDSGEPFYAGAKIIITDVNGNDVTVKTDAQGKYCKDGIEAGDATIKVDLNSLPSGATITTENPTTIDVEAGKTNQAGKDGFEPAATVGKVCGSVFEDTNGNTVQDSGEPFYAGAKIIITDVNGNDVTVKTDAQGKYCKDGIEAGDATIKVDLNSLPSGAKITTENPTTIDVEAGKTNQAGKDGFEPKTVTPTLTGSVCGIVFEDVNRDGVQQVGEPGIENITVTATDINGNLLTGTTDANGDYCISNVAAGNATVTVDANDADMPAGATDTTGTNPSPVNVLANTKNNAGKDGYFNPNRNDLGCVCFVIFNDKDKSGGYNNPPDVGLKNVSVKITDANGVIHTVESDNTGTVKVVLPLGQTTFTVDDKDADLAGFTRSFGTQTVTMINEIGATSAQYHGFTGVAPVIP